MEHIVEFNFEVWRSTPNGGEATKELAIKCSVDVEQEDEGLSYFVSVLSAGDYDGEEIDLHEREYVEVSDIAVSIVKEGA